MESYFSRREDESFSRLVLEYNALGDGDMRKVELDSMIVERTMVLLYLIPQRSFFLREEDAGAFFLDIQPDVPEIIRSFRISGLTYNGYLSQICRYRCMRFMKSKKDRNALETGMVYSDLTAYEEMHEDEVPYSISSPIPDEHIRAMDLNTVIATMMTCPPSREGESLSPEEESMTRLLGVPMKRRQFISLLLSLPETESPGFIAAVSRVMRTDMETVSRFYMLRHEILRGFAEETREALESKAGRHWRTMVKLKAAMAAEGDPAESIQLRERYIRARDAYRRRIGSLKGTYSGFTQLQIASLLGIPRSCVSHDIEAMRKDLIRIHGGG